MSLGGLTWQKGVAGVRRHVGGHLVLVGTVLALAGLALLTIHVPQGIVSSVNKIVPWAGWPDRKPVAVPACDTAVPSVTKIVSGPDDVLVSLDQILKSPVTLEQDDPRLVKRIRTRYMHPPSLQAYNLIGGDDPSMGQSKAIMEVLGDMRGGVFVECGALDGETRSNTLLFEKKMGWTGALIEADPKNFDLMLQKNRKAWAVNACLSTKSYPNTVMFQQQFNIGKISNLDPGMGIRYGHTEVQCFPLFSVLLALNKTTVDYFSLDVEGAELDVLQTIPWDKVDIKTLSVEFKHVGMGKEALRDYMKQRGYWTYKEVTYVNSLANDFIFVKEAFKTIDDVKFQ